MGSASHWPTVVVVEDEAPMRRLLKTVLVAQGYLVFQAENGRRGQIEAGTRKPDLVILDLGLPDLDGIEVIRQLRA
jgi:two-component system, OmpR family, KDP operon response regulator KdpE